MSTTNIETICDTDVATIQISSEKGVNIISSQVVHALEAQVEALAPKRDIRFVIFRGRGKTFVAGADIKEMSILDEDAARSFSQHGHRVFQAIETLPQITFAAINGHALGGGCELALACDFRLIARGALIGQPESKLGLIPGWAGTTRLPRLVGRARAFKLMASGEPVTAEQALEIGLVDEVVADEAELDASLERWFALLKPGSPAAVARLKRTLNDGDEIAQFGSCFACSEAREGMRAFIEKRQAAWMA